MKYVILGLVLVAAGWTLQQDRSARLVTGPLRSTFVDGRAAETAAHGDGPDAFTRERLSELALRLDSSLRALPLLLGLALLAFPLLGRRMPGWSKPWSIAVLTAAFGGGFVLVEQSTLIATGWRSGLFTESDDARDRRFFGEAVLRAAARIKEVVPEDARVLVIRVGVPRDLNALQYQIFPRRVFMLPVSEWQLDADLVRGQVRDRPDAIAPYLAAGYTHALDLLRLVRDDDPRAIVALSGGD